MRPTIIAVENFTFSSTFSSNLPRFAGRTPAKAGRLVDLTADEHHCLNRASADAAARM
jgi:hypothetical protein